MLQSPPPYLDLPPPPVYSLPPSLADTVSQVGEYNYKSDHFHVNLGPRNWGTRFPVYGFQGTVEGTVQFAKKCSRVMSVTATVSALWSQLSYHPLVDRILYHFNSLRGKHQFLSPVVAVSRLRRTK